MLTIYSEEHFRRQPKDELHNGEIMPAFESPARAEMVLQRVRETALGEVVNPTHFDVINSFSDLILDLFGPGIGAHSRSAVGMAELPGDIPVEIEAEVDVAPA